MPRVLGQLIRDLGEVRSELSGIRQALDELMAEAQTLADTADALSSDRFSNAALLRMGPSGRDPFEEKLRRALKGPEKRKDRIDRDLQLWLDTSFDAATIANLKSRLFPRHQIMVVGGGATMEVRDLLSEIEHLVDEIADVERRLAYFRGPGGAPAASPQPTPSREARERDRIFVTYSHADRWWLDRIRTHLAPLIRDGTLDLWDDSRIQPGARWREEIAAALAQSSAAVLLLSADFLASEFIATDELPTILRAEEERGLLVVPIFVAPCRPPGSVAQFQGLNSPDETLDEKSRAAADRVLVKLADLIRERSGHLAAQPAAVAARDRQARKRRRSS